MTRNGTGIYERHDRSCPAETVKARNAGAKCNCTPRFQAKVYSRRDGKPISKTFRTKTEAKQWQAEAKTEIRKGTRRAPSKRTIAEALEELIAGMKDGSIRSRRRIPYRPDSTYGYELDVRGVWIPRIGSRRLGDLTRPELQRVVDDLVSGGLGGAAVLNTLNPLKVMYRLALRNGELDVDPTKGLELPAINGPRDRVVNEDEAAQLIAAAPEFDQPIWAIAFYAGLRKGEIMGLDWKHVDPAGWISVTRSWDEFHKTYGPPKTEAGRRRVPILDRLRPYIEQQWQARQAFGGGFQGPVFFNQRALLRPPPRDRTCQRDGCAARYYGRGLCKRHWLQWYKAGSNPNDLPEGWRTSRMAELEKPFSRDVVQRRADAAWEAAGLERLTFHNCRHTFASILFARGVNPTLIQKWAGHANLSMTLDTYTHLIPGSEPEGIALANSPAPAPVAAPRPRLALGPASDEEAEG